jgi:hypothetical protein
MICLDCRALLGDDERCDRSAAHRVVSLAEADGCAALAAAVWSGPSIARYVSPEAQTGATGLGVVLAMAGGAANSVELIAGAAAVWSGALVASVAAHVSAGRVRPTGGFANLRGAESRRARHRGLAEGRDRISAPLSGEPCLAYLIRFEASAHFGGPVLLYEAASAPFEVPLADGRRVRAPGGRIRLAARSERVIDDTAAIDRFLERFHPGLRAGGPRRPLPYDRVVEAILPAGAEVDLYARTTAEAMSYRESARLLLVRDVPCVGESDAA